MNHYKKTGYNDLVKVSEAVTEHCIDFILNEFYFFCAFSKGYPSHDFIYRRFIGKPYNKYPMLQAISRWFKSYARTLKQYCISKKPDLIGKIDKINNVLVVSWLWDENILMNDRIDREDRYFGSLGEKLKAQGHNVQYLLFPVTRKVENKLTNLQSLSKNIIFNGRKIRPSLSDLIPLIINIGNCNIRRDEYVSLITGFNSLRYITAKKLYQILTDRFKESNINHIIIPWEAQPEQKAICLAAHAAGITVWGYCHAAINSGYTHLINNDWAWCPNVMLVNGFGYVPVLEEMGWRNKIRVIRSLRYLNPPLKSTFEGKVFLPYDVEDSITTLKVLKSMVQDEKLSIKEIRCHPINANNQKIRSLIENIPINTSAEDVYVGGFTSVLFEALQAGCTVYNVQTDPLYSENAYSQFHNIKVTRINKNLIKFEPIGDMDNYFYCFDEKKYLKIS